MRTKDQLRIECTEAGLPEHSRLCEICAGEVFGLEYTNVYRGKWQLPPLTQEEVSVASPPKPRPSDGRVNRRDPVRRKKRTRKRHDLDIRAIAGPKPTGRGCGNCKGSKKVRAPKPNGRGPGSQLIKLMNKAGIPHCDACIELAGKMDQWGKARCRRRMGSIVNDILPRAKEWLASDRPVVQRLLSIAHIEETALRMAIRRKVNEAINLAKERPVARRPRQASVHRAEDVSNLLESTLIKPPAWIKATHSHVEKMPLGSESTRHLLYHIYPKRNDIWKWNVDLLLPHLPLFNGRRIVAIAVDKTTVEAEEVKDAFGGAVVEFMVFRNNKNAGEMISFLPLLAQVQTDDPNVVTFRGHAKGTSRFEYDRRDHLRDWTELLYAVNLADWAQVRKHLEEAAMTGACRKFDQFRKRPPLGKPSYSGSFYWFRNCYAYSRKWQDVDNPRWGCESWPSLLFAKDETRCLLVDDTKSMYDPQYWEKIVRPQYRQWKEKQGR